MRIKFNARVENEVNKVHSVAGPGGVAF